MSDRLEFRPRNMGKSFEQWQEFMKAVSEEKSVVYATPYGEISSPKRTRQLIAAEVDKARTYSINEMIQLLEDVQSAGKHATDAIDSLYKVKHKLKAGKANK